MKASDASSEKPTKPLSPASNTGESEPSKDKRQKLAEEVGIEIEYNDNEVETLEKREAE